MSKQSQNNFPLVSIISPSYNHENYIKQTIVSVVNQTYKNIELIVIDDGSEDSSSTIIRDLQKDYQFKFIARENRGLVNTYNELIENISGEYVAIIESDDIWTLDKIEKQVQFLEENPEYAGCGGNVLHIDGNNTILPYYFQRFKNFESYSFKEIISFQSSLPSITMMFRTKLIKSITPYPEHLKFIDVYNHLHLTSKGYKLALLPDLLGYYRIHPNNTTKKNKLMLLGKLDTLKNFNNDGNYKKGVLKCYKNYYLHKLLFFLPKSLFPFKRS
jgi:alpha-1,3-rhamnosyltransferase